MDPRAVVIGGLTTFAWYAVPDVVGPRWARAATKAAVAVVGATLAVALTRDGEAARSALDSFAVSRTGPDEDPAAAPTPEASETASDGSGPGLAALDPDNPAPLAPTAEAAEVLALRQGVSVAVVSAGALALVALGVAGERWIYRGAEALRARGVRAPHTLVGVGMGVLAAGLAAVDVAPDESRPDVLSE
jgi:hypothetical protein